MPVPFFAAMATAPTHPNILLLAFYVSTVPSFILSALAGRAVGWGVFQACLLAVGLWQYWRWTEDSTNGIRLIGIYVIYGCLNIAVALIFVLYSTLARAQNEWLFPTVGLALAVAIGVLTTQVIRGFPRSRA